MKKLEAKPEFYLNPVMEWQNPALVRATLRYPWPSSIDGAQAMAVAREQFGDPGVKKFPKLVRRINKNALPYEPVLQEEVVGVCEMTHFGDEGMLLEFVLRLPNGDRLEKDLKTDPESVTALPFIVVSEETGEVLRFGDVFVVDTPTPVVLHGAPYAVFTGILDTSENKPE